MLTDISSISSNLLPQIALVAGLANPRRRPEFMKAQAALLLIAILGLIALVGYIAPGLGVRTYLHSHATLWTHITSPDGRFAVATYRFPELHDMPEILGLGQGFVQVLDTRSRKSLSENWRSA